ncbi:MAG: DUF2628 domain-containing protein [Hyphomicrobiaceae bacterium]|nr:MAG: DUF2628 domain-containing protein [Hyphomicrobiaceae bacterium]
MLTFTVHEPPAPPADRIDRAEALVFVKDGFSWAAALFAPLWLGLHRLWLPLLGYIIIAAALGLAQEATVFDRRWVGLAMFAVNLMLGFEAGTLRRWVLDRRGWRMLGSVSGRSVDECERRFFEGWLPSQPIIAPNASSGAGSPPGRTWGGIGHRIGALIGTRS